MRGAPDSLGPGDFVSSVEALRAVVKDSTSLIRLDLQQHTALQVRVFGSSKALCNRAQRMCSDDNSNQAASMRLPEMDWNGFGSSCPAFCMAQDCLVFFCGRGISHPEAAS